MESEELGSGAFQDSKPGNHPKRAAKTRRISIDSRLADNQKPTSTHEVRVSS